MEKTDIKKMNMKELHTEAASLKKDLFDLRLSAASTHIKDNSQFKKLRVRIAQVLTRATQIKQTEQQ